MQTANVAEFKNQLSRFLALEVQGEEIEARKHNVPLSRVVPVNPKRKNRTVLGCGRGSVRIQGDLTEPLIPPECWKIWFRYFVELNGWQTVPIDLEIMEEAYSLPDHFHQDPADRIIVATARIFSCSLVTADNRLLEYPHVQTLW